MGPVTVALLATLIPSSCIIIGLVFLSLYLLFRLRASQAPAEQAEERPSPPPTPPRNQIVVFEDPAKRNTSLSNASNPDWRCDMNRAYPLGPYGIISARVHPLSYTGSFDEPWAREILTDIGYKGRVLVAAMLPLLAGRYSCNHMASHIIAHVIPQRMSLECEPEESLLPFSPDTHRCLRSFYKALEGVKCKFPKHARSLNISLICQIIVSPEVANLISKIPFQLADEYSKQHASSGEGKTEPFHLYKKEVYERLDNRLSELFGPVCIPEWATQRPNVHGKISLMATSPLDKSKLDDSVEFHLRVIASRQRFEFKWKGTTTINGSVIEVTPALYSHASEDGVPLDEPKVWSEGYTWPLEGMGIEVDEVRDGKLIPRKKGRAQKPAVEQIREKSEERKGDGEGKENGEGNRECKEDCT